jgi:LacI family transcriptional regulator
MTWQGPATLAMVAAEAKVSVATASRVLNGERKVGEPHRSRVLRAAERLGYRPNALAQATARGASNLVGLIVHDVADPYFSTIADGVVRIAEEHGFVVVLGSTRRIPEQELKYVTTLNSQRAQAIIIAGSRTTDQTYLARLNKELDSFRRGGGRVAVISQNRLGSHTVQPLNRAGARDLAEALYDLGHRRFNVLAGPKNLTTSADRLAGFLKGLARRGVARRSVQVLHGAFTRDGGFELGSRIAEQDIGGACVFATNDVMAAFRARGIAVPDDVAVAGFDDIATLRDLVPSLTTVHLPLEEMGVRAAELALNTAGRSPRVISVRGEVVLRESTRPR